MKKMRTCRFHLVWVVTWEAAAPPFAQSQLLLFEIIKVVSNGHGPGSLVKVIFAAINPLGWLQ
jgi:hypothetical protein